MKILFVIDQMKIGGIETLLVRTVRQLLQQGHEPVVLSMAYSGNLLADLEATGATVRSITNNVKDLGFFKPTMLGRLRRVMREEKPDILHLCDIISGHMGRIASLGLGMSVIYHLHSTVSHDKKKYRIMDRFLSFATKQYVSASQAVEKARLPSSNWAGRAQKVLYNGIDVQDLKNSKCADLSRLIPASGSVLLTVGRLAPSKNIARVIQTVARLRKQFTNLTLLIVGDGTERERLEKLTYTLGCNKHVVFLGFRSDVPSILKTLGKRQSIFVMPSEHEGFGIAPLEGMFFGIPAIINKNIPLVEIAAEASLVCTTDVDDIVEKITTLLNNNILYEELAKAAQEIAPRHSMEQYVERLLEIYTKEVRT